MIRSIRTWWMTRGDSHTAWSRCLPIWRQAGGVNDWRGIIGRPFYIRSDAVCLAQTFAKRHSKDVLKILQHTQDNDYLTALCAIDLLTHFGTIVPTTIPALIGTHLPLSESLRGTLTEDAELTEKLEGNPTPTFDSLGAYYRWQFESQN